MKIVISASSQSLDAELDPRFGRCPFFIITDTETGQFSVEANAGLDASGGAGIAAAQQVAVMAPDAVLTGHCGPNAFTVLDKANIKVYTNVTGTVSEAIQKCVDGSLRAATASNATPHSVMGQN